ncbi:MAG: hypothetical protein R3D56_00670 [Paracoccaceae bacterium]
MPIWKTTLNRLTFEMSSGRQQDLCRKPCAATSRCRRPEHSLSVLASFRTAASEAGTLIRPQTAFETVQTIISDLAPFAQRCRTTGGVDANFDRRL